jgi:uncharacterized membrane protein YkvA (DUF1232 family)
MTFHGILRKLRLLWLAFFDSSTPVYAKLLVVGGLVYGVSPLDLIPDFIPLLGQTDDLGVLLIVFLFFLRASKSVREKLAQSVQ